MRRILSLATAGALACAAPSSQRSGPAPIEHDPAARADELAAALDGYRAAFVLTFAGRRIGEAHERFDASAEASGGFRFVREERVVVKRDGVVATTTTAISIDVDPTLTARRIVVQRRAGRVVTEALAERLYDETWRIAFGSEPARLVDGRAVPSTLVPLMVAARGIADGEAFSGLVLVEGSGLAQAQLTVEISGGRRVAHAAMETRSGRLRARALLDDSGFVASAGEPEGVASRRADDATLAAPFDPPEVVSTSSVPVEGSPGSGGLRLAVSDVAAMPPALPELGTQRIAVDADGGWRIDVASQPFAPGELDGVRAEVARVRRALRTDMGSFSIGAGEAMEAGGGDCTAHAVVLERLLGARGLNARLVTGFVLEGGVLARHRWVAVRVGARWVTVDPMFGEVPASSAHVALAMHGSDPDELAFVDELTFAGWSRARARVIE